MPRFLSPLPGHLVLPDTATWSGARPEPVHAGALHPAGLPRAEGPACGLFLLFLVMLLLTVAANLAIISLVATHRPSRGSCTSSCAISPSWRLVHHGLLPKTLDTFARRVRAISMAGCAAQRYLVFSLGCTEYFLLAAMAYGRYLALCLPSGCSWLGGFSLGTAVLITRLSFCGSRVANHFCDIAPWVVLSCTDPRVVELASFGSAFCGILGSCCVTRVSHAHDVVTVVRIPSVQGRHRALHLLVPPHGGARWFAPPSSCT